MGFIALIIKINVEKFYRQNRLLYYMWKGKFMGINWKERLVTIINDFSKEESKQLLSIMLLKCGYNLDYYLDEEEVLYLTEGDESEGD